MRVSRLLSLALVLSLAVAPGAPGLLAGNLQVGKDFYELRRFTDALAALKLAIQEDSSAWEAYYYTGLIYHESGKPDLALKYFASSWRVKPGNEKVSKLLNEAFTSAAAKARAAGGAEAAVGEPEGAFKLGFFSAELANQLMDQYLETEKYESVKTLSEEVFQRQGNFTLFPRDGTGTKRSHLLAGRAYFETREYEKALEHFEIASVGREEGAQEYWQKTQSALAGLAKPYLDQGEQLYRDGQIREARVAFEKALKYHKDNPFARKMLLKIDNVVKAQELESQAGNALAQGNSAEALDLLRQAVLLYPENTRLMEQIKDIQSRAAALEATRAARESAQTKARQEHQEKFAALIQKARELEEKEQYTEAQTAYQEALQLFPNDESVKSSLAHLTDRVEVDRRYRNAVALFEGRRWAESISEFRSVDDKSENGFRQSRRHLAMAHLNLNKLDEFERYAQLSLERSPDDLELLYLLADLDAQPDRSSSRLKEAYLRFKQIEKLNPAYKDVAQRLQTIYWRLYWPEYLVGVLLVVGYAVVYIFMKQKPKLLRKLFLKDLERLSAGSDWAGVVALHGEMKRHELDNRDALQVHMTFARGFFETRQFGRAITEGQLAMRLSPRNKEARVLLGRAFYANKTISQEVLEFYLDLLEVEPDNRVLLNYVGTFCTDKKILNPTTLALLRQLAQVQPDNDKVRQLLMRSYLKDNDRSAGAMALYRVEIERNPKNLDVRCVLAEELLKKGEVEKAIQECEEMLNVSLNHPKTHDLLVEAYTKMGKLPSLIKTYQSILENEPHNTFIQDRLGRLVGTTPTGTVLPPPPDPDEAAPAVAAAPAPDAAPAKKASRQTKAATPVRGTQKCPKCGSDVQIGSYFCSCGCPL